MKKRKRVVIIGIFVVGCIILTIYPVINKTKIIENVLLFELPPNAIITEYSTNGKVAVDIYRTPGIYFRSLYAKVEGDSNFYDYSADIMRMGAQSEEILNFATIDEHLKANGYGHLIEGNQDNFEKIALYTYHVFTAHSYDVLMMLDHAGNTIMHILACDNWSTI